MYVKSIVGFIYELNFSLFRFITSKIIEIYYSSSFYVVGIAKLPMTSIFLQCQKIFEITFN